MGLHDVTVCDTYKESGDHHGAVFVTNTRSRVVMICVCDKYQESGVFMMHVNDKYTKSVVSVMSD